MIFVSGFSKELEKINYLLHRWASRPMNCDDYFYRNSQREEEEEVDEASEHFISIRRNKIVRTCARSSRFYFLRASEFATGRGC